MKYLYVESINPNGKSVGYIKFYYSEKLKEEFKNFKTFVK